MKKKVYSMPDGVTLVIAAAIIANVDKETKTADIVDAKGDILVKGVPYSETPKDGHWSEVIEYVPGPPQPDERDARIADLEARLAAAESATTEATKAKTGDPAKTGPSPKG